MVSECYGGYAGLFELGLVFFFYFSGFRDFLELEVGIMLGE